MLLQHPPILHTFLLPPISLSVSVYSCVCVQCSLGVLAPSTHRTFLLLPVYLSVYLCVCDQCSLGDVAASTHPSYVPHSTYLCMCLFICVSVFSVALVMLQHPPILHTFLLLPVYLSVYLCVCVQCSLGDVAASPSFIHSSFHLSLCLSVCLSVCLRSETL